MGLLDQIMGGGADPGRRPGFGSTVAAGVVLALLVKAIRQHQNAQAGAAQPRSFDPQAQDAAPAAGAGGLLGGAGGLGGLLGGLGGGGLGQMLAGLGGAGALQSLISRFHENGYGPQVSSWVGQGQNQPIQPDQVAAALGDHAVDELQQKTGVPRQNLLAEIAQALPQALNQITPQGRTPTDDELHEIASSPAPQ
jgi:uncharacterized protein YidB (DUF937 family)